jgi:DNA-directed RNA polymerase specialized sigma24 family protein
MASLPKLHLVDRRGSPLSERIRAALQSLLPDFRRQFPQLRDEAVILNLVEEAGRKIAEHESRHGQIEHLQAFARKTLTNLGISWTRGPEGKLNGRTVDPAKAGAALETAKARHGAPEQIFQEVLLRQLLERLTEEERAVCIRRRAGWSSKEIAKELRRSPAQVDSTFHRATQKLREALDSKRGRVGENYND